jgi:hypothetical protein
MLQLGTIAWARSGPAPDQGHGARSALSSARIGGPSEAPVVSLIVRGLLLLSGTVTGWFVAHDAPNFSFIQGMVSLMVIAVIVFVIAFWPTRWTHLLDRRNKPE